MNTTLTPEQRRHIVKMELTRNCAAPTLEWTPIGAFPEVEQGRMLATHYLQHGGWFYYRPQNEGNKAN